jgi:hypothetical protein
VRDKEREFQTLERRDYRVEAILANALVKAKTQLRLQKEWQLMKIELPKAENSGTCSDNQPDQLDEGTSGVINSTSTVICLETEMKSSVRYSTTYDFSVELLKHYFSRPLVNYLAEVTSRLKRICHLVFNWYS